MIVIVPHESALEGNDDLNKSGRHVVDQAGNKPFGRQCRNRPQQSNVDGNCRPWIGDRFCLQFLFLNLKIVRKHGSISSEASDATIGVLEHDYVKLPLHSAAPAEAKASRCAQQTGDWQNLYFVLSWNQERS